MAIPVASVVLLWKGVFDPQGFLNCLLYTSHQLMTEAGYVKPGDIAFGTDSHTTTYGCVGAFSSGIGYTEMASILGTGTMWIKVPETIKVVIDGELPENVMSKDIILRLIGDLRADGATYRALEFSGSTIAVSYTHLDVYKRQRQKVSGSGFFTEK